MNISSAIVKVKSGIAESVTEKLKEIEGCEIHIIEGERIIITIEAEDVSGEIAIVKAAEQLDGVLAVEMVYAYSEEELDKERDKVEIAEETPEWLNNESLDARDIKYGGKKRKKV